MHKFIEIGLGFHHAGMMRSDRNIVEKMFLDGNIRVLCATSTLVKNKKIIETKSYLINT